MTREEAIRLIGWLKCTTNREDDLEAIDMAIEALSAEEAVWNEYEAEFTDLPDIPRYYYEKVVGKMAHEINMLREQLESADAVQEWIPCSERLPSESGDYLCTIPLDADETYTEVLMFHKGRFYEDDAEWGATFHDDVYAWMPLPKPYKGGDDE